MSVGKTNRKSNSWVMAPVVSPSQRPDAMPDDDALVHDYCVELLNGRGQVGDALWARAVARFG